MPPKNQLGDAHCAQKRNSRRISHIPARACVIAYILLWLMLCPATVCGASWHEGEDIFFWGHNIDKNYATRDVTYPKAAKGFDSSGIFRGRKKAVKNGRMSFLRIQNGLLEVTSQVWKEKSPDPFYAYYQNTTEFYWKTGSGDYKVEVTVANPTSKSYSAFLRSGTEVQSLTKKVNPGTNAVLTGTVSVTGKELFFSVLAASDATSLKAAKKKKVYVKKIHITKLPREDKGDTPTIFFAGDSTSAYYSEAKTPWEGWGQEFYRYFKKRDTVRQKSFSELGFNTNYLNGYREYKMSNITIENWSVPGETTRTFLESGKWDGILNKVRPGDYVFVQFGHNDGVKEKGIKYTSLTDYKKNLAVFAKGCRQRGASCIFFSPIAKCTFRPNGDCKPWVDSYRKAMRSVALAQQVPFVDMGLATANFLTDIGEESAKSYYMFLKKGRYGYFPGGKEDAIHLQKKGADKYAQIAAALISKHRSLTKLTSYLRSDIDYYAGTTKTLKLTRIEKAGKKTWRLYWKRQPRAKYYKIYIKKAGKKTYQYLSKRYRPEAKITGYSTKKKHKFMVKAVY